MGWFIGIILAGCIASGAVYCLLRRVEHSKLSKSAKLWITIAIVVIAWLAFFMI